MKLLWAVLATFLADVVATSDESYLPPASVSLKQGSAPQSRRGEREGLAPLLLGILVATLNRRLSTTTTVTTTPDPFSGWASRDGCRYQAFFDVKTHSDAKIACTEKGPDAKIAHTGFKTVADRILAAKYANLPEGSMAWIGLEDATADAADNPLFMDGSAYHGVTVFLDGLTAADETCGVFSLSFQPPNVVFGACTTQRYYICEVCP